ncbi:hypothetical protein RFI_35663, partial [Reticulomyxa filosa]
GVNQTELKETLIKNNLLYWAAGRNIISIRAENSNSKKFDEGWYPMPFLIFRIFLCERITSAIKILSKQLKVKYDVCNGIAMEQTLVAKANIHTIQNGAFYRRDQSIKPIFNYILIRLNETNLINFTNQNFPNLFKV